MTLQLSQVGVGTKPTSVSFSDRLLEGLRSLAKELPSLNDPLIAAGYPVVIYGWGLDVEPINFNAFESCSDDQIQKDFAHSKLRIALLSFDEHSLIDLFSGDAPIRLPLRSLHSQGGYLYRDDQITLLLERRFENVLMEVLDRKRSRAYVVLLSPDRSLYRPWIQSLAGEAAPFRNILTWYLVERGGLPLHSAAIAHAGRAALIAGTSGVGKSTTALRCLIDGMEYLGDDSVCVTLEAGMPGHRATVRSMFCSARLYPDDLEGMSSLKRYQTGDPSAWTRKSTLFFAGSDPSLHPPERALAALVVPYFSSGAAPEVRCISKGEALRALAPSTLIRTAGLPPFFLQSLTRLVAAVPCFSLGLAPSGSSPAACLKALLATLEV